MRRGERKKLPIGSKGNVKHSGEFPLIAIGKDEGEDRNAKGWDSYVGMILQRNCTTVHAPRIPFKYKIKFNRTL